MAKQKQKKTKKGKDVYSGFEKLAFGRITDAIRLLYSDNAPDADEIDLMDLFNISEIKRAKGGGMEIKFFDRLKALEKMHILNEENAENAPSSFYEAISKSVIALTQGKDEQNE